LKAKSIPNLKIFVFYALNHYSSFSNTITLQPCNIFIDFVDKIGYNIFITRDRIMRYEYGTGIV